MLSPEGYENCTLHVPVGTRWAYRHHPVFRQFKNIVTEQYDNENGD
jgi:hypothetical protein